MQAWPSIKYLFMSVRFAPSPTGHFHVGNLRTAWISFELSKILKQDWVLRFEDIDKPRVVSGARESQRADLKQIGCVAKLEQLQSENHKRHFDLFLSAIHAGVVYPCICSRKQVQESLRDLASAPNSSTSELIYDGSCRDISLQAKLNKVSFSQIAWRFKNSDQRGFGDFIIARTPKVQNVNEINDSDFVPAYHWACAVDDFDLSPSLVVRCWDLESATEIQRTIQKWLKEFLKIESWKAPSVYHCALVCDKEGRRLEKRTLGVTLKELLSSGWSPPSIIECFSNSFKAPNLNDLLNSTLSGEVQKKLNWPF